MLRTFKEHSAVITCISMSDFLVSGSEDGRLNIFDISAFKHIKTIKCGSAQSSYPIAVGTKTQEFGFAVGLSNKTVKYYEGNDFSLVC